MSTEKKNTITLRSSDNQTFEVPEAVALVSQTIKHLVEDGCADAEIPVPNVDSATLVKVIEYCKVHSGDESAGGSGSTSEDKDSKSKKFDEEFVKDMGDYSVLFNVILAANYLDVKGLLDLTCQAVADNIKNKTPEHVRAIFNIKNDFTPEEEAALREENEWAFD